MGICIVVGKRAVGADYALYLFKLDFGTSTGADTEL